LEGPLMVFDATVTCISRVQCVPGGEDRLREILAELVGPSMHQPGCLQYQILRRVDFRSEFLIVEKWRSEAAWRRHGEESGILSTFERAAPLLAAPTQYQIYRQVE
jgi:quinol monooxygenase YgiN